MLRRERVPSTKLPRKNFCPLSMVVDAFQFQRRATLAVTDCVPTRSCPYMPLSKQRQMILPTSLVPLVCNWRSSSISSKLVYRYLPLASFILCTKAALVMSLTNTCTHRSSGRLGFSLLAPFLFIESFHSCSRSRFTLSCSTMSARIYSTGLFTADFPDDCGAMFTLMNVASFSVPSISSNFTWFKCMPSAGKTPFATDGRHT